MAREVSRGAAFAAGWGGAGFAAIWGFAGAGAERGAGLDGALPGIAGAPSCGPGVPALAGSLSGSSTISASPFFCFADHAAGWMPTMRRISAA